jgi:hypothetical protein
VGANRRNVHFGVNDAGLVNVFAKDIAELPERYQKLWAVHNTAPDGGVCSELLDAQMKCMLANTTAPELHLMQALRELQMVTADRWGQSLVKGEISDAEFLQTVHRFLSIDDEGLCRLCKEITRQVVERLDTKVLRKMHPGLGDNVGSLKRLDHWLAEANAWGTITMDPFFVAYELRHRDAHRNGRRAPSEIFGLGRGAAGDYLRVGKGLIGGVACVLAHIANFAREHGSKNTDSLP